MSLFQSRTSGDVVAEILMSKTTFVGGYLLVEGPSDSIFFKSRVSQPDCQIIICGSKNTVIQTTKIAKQQTNSSTLGVIDDDFDSHIGIQHNCSDLISTDTHDIETLMLSSDAIHRLLDEYADETKLKSLVQKENKEFVDLLLDRSVIFGKLRFISVSNRLNINFEDFFSPWKFIDKLTWELDRTRLFQEFSNHSHMSISDIQNTFNSISNIPPWNFSQGHDTVHILSIAFSNIIKSKKSLSPDNICSALRLAYDQLTFAGTRMFGSIKNWENINSQRVLS